MHPIKLATFTSIFLLIAIYSQISLSQPLHYYNNQNTPENNQSQQQSKYQHRINQQPQFSPPNKEQIFDCQVDLCTLNRTHNIAINIPVKICDEILRAYHNLPQFEKIKFRGTCPVPPEEYIAAHNQYLLTKIKSFILSLLNKLSPEIQEVIRAKIQEHMTQLKQEYAYHVSNQDAFEFYSNANFQQLVNVFDSYQQIPYRGPLPENLDLLLLHPHVQRSLGYDGIESVRNSFSPCNECEFPQDSIADFFGLDYDDIRLLNAIGELMNQKALEEEQKLSNIFKASVKEAVNDTYEIGKATVNIGKSAAVFLIDIDGDNEIAAWEIGLAILLADDRLVIGATGKVLNYADETIQTLTLIDKSLDTARYLDDAAPFAGSQLQRVSDLAYNTTITDDFLYGKVLRVHGPNSTIPGKSLFTEEFDIKRGIQFVLDSPNTAFFPNTQGRQGTIMILDFGETIGVNKNGSPLTRLKVVMDNFGNLITSYPY